jgi:hypothetical protein
MTLVEKMHMWAKESNPHGADNCRDRDTGHATLDTLDDFDNFDGFDEFEIPELSKYRQVLAEAPAYQWLQSSLRVSSSLQVPESNRKIAYHHIGDQIIKAASSTERFSRKRTQELRMHFTVDWDPALFAQEQQYEAPLDCVLAQAITLTGHDNNLQAATCQSYLKQVWPESGPQLLSLLQRAVKGGSNACTCE